MDGGPAQHETFDPKPDAPAEIRGCLGALSTSVPGLLIGEGLPRMPRRMDRVALIRTLTHAEERHERAAHRVLTGRAPDPARVHPSIAAQAARALEAPPGVPVYAARPDAGFGAG